MPPTNADYAKINIACKQLGIDKYELIADRYGIDSTKNLSKQQTMDLMQHFKLLGWQPKRGKGKKSFASPIYDSAVHRKVVALWITLYQAGVIKNRADYSMQQYVKRMSGKDNLRWCDSADCSLIIEGLKAMGNREAAKQDAKN